MKAASYVLTMTRGDDVRITIRSRENVYDPFTQSYTPGPYNDLTGWTGRCQFRATPDDPTFVEATVAMDADQVNKTGQFTVVLTEAQTLLIEDGWGFDIELVDGDGFKQTYVTGTVKWTKDYTHD